MQLLPWLPATLEGLLVYAGMLLVWAECLYVATRGGRRPVSICAALAMAAFAVYLLGLWSGALSFPDAPERWVWWLRITWWGSALAAALWFVLVVLLASDESDSATGRWLRRSRGWLAAAAIAGGVAVALLGVGTELILRWSAAFSGPAPVIFGADPAAWHLPPGPAFGPYLAFLLVMLGAPAIILGLVWQSAPSGPIRGRFRGLFGSAVLLLLGGAWLAIGSGLWHASALPGEVLLVTGMASVGWNIARYGALVNGEVLTADVRAFAISTLALIGLYAVLLLFVPAEYAWPEGERLLLVLVLTTHALADRSSELMDRWLFEPTTGSLRRRLRFLVERVGREPDPTTALVGVREELRVAEPPLPAAAADERELRLLVEGGLRHLNDLPWLSEHPLIGATPSTRDADLTHIEAANRVRQDLVASIERLRPSTPRPTPGRDGAVGGWLHYLVLYEAYVDGRPNMHIMQRYYLSESTFHRVRRRAVDAVASDLHQRLVGAR